MKSNKSEVNNYQEQIPLGFKQSDIGLIPEDWEVIDFESTLAENDFSRNNLIPRSEFKSEGKYPIIDQGQEYIAGYTDIDEKVYKIKEPVVLFGDHTRIFKYIDFIFVGGADGIKIFTPQNKLYDSRFYFYALTHLNIPSRGYNRHYKLLKEQKIVKPPLPEQKKIAYVLSKIQQAIETQEQIIKTTQELKKALMQKLFTEGLNGEPQKQTEIGLIPESWKIVEFENSIIDNDFSRNNLINASEIKEVGSSPVIDQGQSFIAGYSDYSSKVYNPKNPVIIFGDHTRIFKYVDFPFIGGADGIKVFSPNPHLFNSKFYYYFLSQLDIPSRGYNRHYKLLKEKKIPKPSIDEQKEIATILSLLDSKMQSQTNKKVQLQDLFKILLNQLMTGQIRVKDIEFELEENINTPTCLPQASSSG